MRESVRLYLGVAIMMIAAITVIFITQNKGASLFSDSVSRRINSIQGSYPMEILTDSSEEIRQWFEGKMDFAVRLPEFLGPEIRPVGARICHLNGRRVAYVTYIKDGHTVSMFTLDMDGVKIPYSRKMKLIDHTFYMKTEEGYTSILCLDRRLPGMATIWVSDLSPTQIIKWAIS